MFDKLDGELLSILYLHRASQWKYNVYQNPTLKLI